MEQCGGRFEQSRNRDDSGEWKQILQADQPVEQVKTVPSVAARKGFQVAQSYLIRRTALKHLLELFASLGRAPLFGKSDAEIETELDDLRLEPDSFTEMLDRGGILAVTAQFQSEPRMGFGEIR